MNRWMHRFLLGMAVLAAAMGLTTTLREARASSPTPQLPDLVADPPDNISLAQSEETPTQEHMKAELLLRFNGYLHNKGPGALDFRGMRSAPTNPSEPASPQMGVFQRIYEYPSTEGPPPTAETTPHKDDPSNGVMEYVTADGHEHWHLQHVAKYSLWNATKTAEVAPSQKVGFCLEDSEHIEYWKGPEEQIYKEGGEHPREFCRYRQPTATEVFEGISEGWRDVYTSNLAFQWVDVSDVEPGEYFLRAEADPEHFIQETPEEKPAAYAEKPTVVPGFDASTQVVNVNIDQPLTVKLSSKRWEGLESDEQPSSNPVYEIVGPPAHGTLGPIEGDQVQYTPAAGYNGPDSFTFTARDPHSAFPQSPAVASVSLDVGSHPPSVGIEGAPTSMIAGTSISLSAVVQNDADEVKWSSSFPTITSTGPETATYTAPSTPPPGGFVTVTADTPSGGHDQRTIEIRPYVVPAPKPEVPPATAPTPGKSTASVGPLSKPTAMLIGHKLYMTATAEQAGRLRLTAIVRGRRVGSCLAQVRRRQALTCTTVLPRWVSTKARIGVWATLRVGDRLIQTVRHPARVPSAMKAMAAASWRGIQAAWRYLCGG
ncbi:MAG: lysyl oxidase family protein [Solirubrobacteraceae bacterium]